MVERVVEGGVADQAERLKQLNSDYYHGLLGWERYRTERGWLLDGLDVADSGAAVGAESALPPLSGGLAGTNERTAARTDDTAGAASGLGASNRGLLIAAAVVAGVVVMAVVGWLLSGSQDEPSPPPMSLATSDGATSDGATSDGATSDGATSDGATSDGATSDGATSDPAHTLVQEFLEEDDWTTNSVSSFLFLWDDLTFAEQDRARATPWFRTFVTRISERIRADRLNGAPEFRDGRPVVEHMAQVLELGLELPPPLGVRVPATTNTGALASAPGVTPEATPGELPDRNRTSAESERAPAELSVDGPPELAAKEGAIPQAVVDALTREISARAEEVQTQELQTQEVQPQEERAQGSPVAAGKPVRGSAVSHPDDVAGTKVVADPVTSVASRNATVKPPQTAGESQARVPTGSPQDTRTAAATVGTVPTTAIPVETAKVAAAKSPRAPVAVEDSAPASDRATLPASTPLVTSAGRGEPPVSRQPCTVARLKMRSPVCWDMLAAEHKGPALAVVPPGTFQMGDASVSGAVPVQSQVIANAFAIGVFEISVADYSAFCRETGRTCPNNQWASDDYPVVNVTWDDAKGYAGWLSARTGARYRLPTDIEWEYAARAGTASAYPSGDKVSADQARYASSTGTHTPLPADDRSLGANEFYLFHTAGNVREWVSGWWQTDSAQPSSRKRIVRGGGYADPPEQLKSASRLPVAVAASDTFTGFRVVRELAAQGS